MLLPPRSHSSCFYHRGFPIGFGPRSHQPSTILCRAKSRKHHTNSQRPWMKHGCFSKFHKILAQFKATLSKSPSAPHVLSRRPSSRSSSSSAPLCPGEDKNSLLATFFVLLASSSVHSHHVNILLLFTTSPPHPHVTLHLSPLATPRQHPLGGPSTVSKN